MIFSKATEVNKDIFIVLDLLLLQFPSLLYYYCVSSSVTDVTLWTYSELATTTIYFICWTYVILSVGLFIKRQYFLRDLESMIFFLKAVFGIPDDTMYHLQMNNMGTISVLITSFADIFLNSNSYEYGIIVLEIMDG